MRAARRPTPRAARIRPGRALVVGSAPPTRTLPEPRGGPLRRAATPPPGAPGACSSRPQRPAGGYCTHPGLLEGALQLSEGGLPAALEAFVSGARSLWAARAQAGCGQRGAWDVALCGSEGAVCVRGLVHRGVRALGGRRGAWDAAASTHLYEVAWEAARPEGRAEHAPELRMADALAGRMAGDAATLLQVVQVVSTAGSSQAAPVQRAPAPPGKS